MYSIPRSDIEDLILGSHDKREVNHAPRGADWRLTGPSYTVVYDHPDRDDWLVAAVVTVWRKP